MENITEDTEKVMKEASNETTQEKEMGVAESIATIKTIKKVIESTDGINSKLPRFIAVWSALTLVLYAMSYFVGSWITYLYSIAPLIAWSTFGFTYIIKKKRLATYSIVERRILTVWTCIALFTVVLSAFPKDENHLISFGFTVFGIALAGLCLRTVERSNTMSVGYYIFLIYYGMFLIIEGNFELATREKILFPLFLLFILLDSFIDSNDISYRKRGTKV
ncbi:hypothetical protein [Prevotella intermedia]|nr:hypothetical protein [Prevotella intermedia]